MPDPLLSSGIYAIINKINGKIYIGSAAISFKNRRYTHFRALKNNEHTNSILQNSWNKHGKDNFIFEIVEIVNNNNLLLEREQYWMDYYQSYNREKGYNISPTAGSNLGLKYGPMSDEAKNKIAKSLLEKNALLSLDICLKIKEDLLAKPIEILWRDYEIELSKKYNCNKRQIRNIKAGNSWCSDKLNGSYDNWINYNKNELFKSIKNELKIETNEKAKEKDKRIANLYNVSDRTVQRIRLGEIYIEED